MDQFVMSIKGIFQPQGDVPIRVWQKAGAQVYQCIARQRVVGHVVAFPAGNELNAEASVITDCALEQDGEFAFWSAQQLDAGISISRVLHGGRRVQ